MKRPSTERPALGSAEAATDLAALREAITGCVRCPRLVRFRGIAGAHPPRAFAGTPYWGRPVPGVGDPAARLLVVGLAPSAHGANRTGRMFTGDRSAHFLVAALYRAGYASQPASTHRGDGLRYTDLYLTAAARCVPPDNRPRPEELAACRGYLSAEIRLLPRLRAILCLGGVAWEATLAAAAEVYGAPAPKVPFAHGTVAVLGTGRPLLYASYHPSPQNTQTGRLTERMFDDLVGRVRAGYATPEGGRPAPDGRRTPNR